MTIAQVLHGEPRPAGFDYMRLLLALAVVFSHVINLSYGQAAADAVEQSSWRPLQAFILPMFFSLSGFLIAGSLERCRTAISFFGLRIIRLFPALLVESALAALLLGPMFTTLSLDAYFRDPMFGSYFWNLAGDPQYYPPGVFRDLPHQMVNGQLWALPWELACYASLGGLALLGVLRDRRSVLFAAVSLTAIELALGVLGHAPDAPFLAKPALVECFLFGAAGYLYAEVIPLRKLWLASAALSSCLFLFSPYGDYLMAPCLAYVTLCLGLSNPKRGKVILSGDYSYGIYLYGFPVQQAIISMVGPQPWYIALALALPTVIAVSVLSWHLVEKPAQRMRKALFRAENLWVKFRVSSHQTEA